MRLPALLLCAVVSAAAAAEPAPVVQVKGSDTIGGKLGQDFAKAYMARHPGVTVRWEALGSGTAFVGLLDGSAQLGAASRAVKASERDEAHTRNIDLREYVIGFDGIAVIVNHRNPINSLTVDQLSDLFTGKLRNWQPLGGPDQAVHIVSRPSYSGTFSFFRDKVLRRGNDKGPEDYAPSTEFIEENGAILEKVAADPAAVSYVGIGWLKPSVKAIAILARPNERGVLPSVATVRTGTYPIYRPLLIYSPGEPHGAARDLLAFVLSGEGQSLVASNDFVPLDAPQALPAETGHAATAGTAAAGARLVLRVQFPRGAELTPKAASDIKSLAATLKTSTDNVLVVGNADARGSKTVNNAMALARAKAVAQILLGEGVSAERILVEGHGADEPVGTNNSTRGRGSNRRVDISVVPTGAASSGG